MPQALTPEQGGEFVELTRLAQNMIRTVAASGSGYYTPEVEAFQVFWNDVVPLIERTIGQQLPRDQRQLEEDGMYGPKTSGALAFTLMMATTTLGIPPLPVAPRRASGMPAFYTANRSAVEELVPPNLGTPAEEVLNMPVPAPPAEGAATVPPEVFDATQNSSGSLVQEHIAVATNGGETPSTEVVADLVDANMHLDPGGDPGIEDWGELAETPVVGTARSGGVPWVAVGAGTVALGGLFWWWTQRRKR